LIRDEEIFALRLAPGFLLPATMRVNVIVTLTAPFFLPVLPSPSLSTPLLIVISCQATAPHFGVTHGALASGQREAENILRLYAKSKL